MTKTDRKRFALKRSDAISLHKWPFGTRAQPSQKRSSAALLVAALALPAALPGAAGRAVAFEWAAVGNAGNVADVTGYGAVGYEYRISKHEVTNAQYAEFLNAVAATDTYNLYNSQMGSNGRGGDDYEKHFTQPDRRSA